MATRRAAIERLSGNTIGDHELAMIETILADDDPLVRRRAAALLGKLALNPQAYDLAISAVGDTDWVVREAAIESLGELLPRRPDQALERLIASSLYDRKPLIRQLALKVVSRHADRWEGTRVLEPYVAAATDRRFGIRCRALIGLANFHHLSPAALRQIRASANDSHVKVRACVIRIVPLLGRDALALVPTLGKRRFDASATVREDVRRSLAELSETAPVPLRVAISIVIEHDDPATCLTQLLDECVADDTELMATSRRRAEWISSIDVNAETHLGVRVNDLHQRVQSVIEATVAVSSTSHQARRRKQQLWFIEQILKPLTWPVRSVEG